MSSFPLFELAKCMTYSRDSTTKTDKEHQVLHHAWKEAGERSILALLFSNGYILLRYSVHGRPPVVRQVPWHPDRPIQSMCLDSTATWLLCVTDKQVLYIIPVLAMVDPKAQVNQIWRVDDVTRIRAVKRRGIPTCVCWWQTLDGQNIAIVGTKLGFIQFIHLEKGTAIAEADVNEFITSIELVTNDSQTLTYALITTKSNSQWKLFLEVLGAPQQWPDDDELISMGFEQVDSRHIPINTILKQSDETSHEFLPLKFYQFASSVVLSPQYAKGRHFVAAHDLRSSLYQIYDSNLEHSPLYIYQVPEAVDHVILTDRMLFLTSTGESSSLSVLANQMTEASADGTQEFNREALVQQFDIAPEEQVLAVLKRSFPFYWHEKREEETRSRSSSSQTSDSNQNLGSTDISQSFRISYHTVLDGCLVVTSHSIYECRPRISPERLFLELALDQTDTSPAEHLAIALGLDINALYQMAALYRLDHADYPQAYRFFQLAKTPHSKRVAYFAKYGRIGEVMMYLQTTLASKCQELSVVERGRLADLALHCHLQLSLVQGSPCADTTRALRDFLMTNRWFDKKLAVKLLSDYGFSELLVEYAKVKGLGSDVTEHVLSGLGQSQLQSSTDISGKLAQAQLYKSTAGSLINMYTPSSLCQLLRSRPQVASNFLERIQDDLIDLEPHELLKVVTLLDMSRPPVATYVRQTLAKQKRRRRLSGGSVWSLTSEVSHTEEEDVEGFHIRQLVQIFTKAVILLNASRQQPQLTLKDLDVYQPLDNTTQEEDDDSPSFCLLPRPQPISCGTDHTAVVVDGRLYTWGSTEHGRLGVGQVSEEVLWKPMCITSFPPSGHQVMSVACGGQHTLALTQDGRVYGWGMCNFGQVGLGKRGIQRIPTLVPKLANVVCVSIAAGQHHSLALTQDCSLYSWGWGVHGQLGHGNPEDMLEPTRVSALDGLHPARIAAGYAHTILCTVQGSIYTFGNGMFGQLGLGAKEKTSIPEKVEFPEPVCCIASGSFHNIVLTDNGHVYQWGAPPQVLRYAVQVHRRARQQGKAPPSTELVQLTDHLEPKVVDLTGVDSKITQVHCGSNFSALVTGDGEVFTWGKNLDGQLGIGNRMEQKNPVMVFKINDRKVVHLSCGFEYIVSMDTDGQLWGWGRNDNGQIGVPLGPQQQTSEKRYGVKITELLSPIRIQGVPKVAQSLNETDGNLLLEECLQDPGLELPDFGGNSEEPYGTATVFALIKAMTQYCDVTQLCRLSVDHRCWGTATRLCLLGELYPQALHYHLQMLALQPSELAVEDVVLVVQYYLRLVLTKVTEAHVKESSINQLLEEVLMFWGQKCLPLKPLEDLLNQHLNELAPNLFFHMERKCGNMRDKSTVEPASLEVPHSLLEKMSTSFLLNLTRIVVGLIDENKLSTEQLHRLCPGLQPSQDKQTSVDKMISPEKLWQEILQNLKKDLDVRSHIKLTQNQLEILSHQQTVQSGQQESSSPSPNAAVLFTCGHHFAKQNFLETVLPNFEENLSKKGSVLSQTTSLLSTYYRRQGPHPMACPTCVIQAVSLS